MGGQNAPPGAKPSPRPSPNPGPTPSPTPRPSPGPGPRPSPSIPGAKPSPPRSPAPAPRPSPNFGGLQTPPSSGPGGPSNGGDGGNLPNTCFKRSNAWPIEMCDGTVCNGAEGGRRCSLLPLALAARSCGGAEARQPGCVLCSPQPRSSSSRAVSRARRWLPPAAACCRLLQASTTPSPSAASWAGTTRRPRPSGATASTTSSATSPSTPPCPPTRRSVGAPSMAAPLAQPALAPLPLQARPPQPGPLR
jgi:hypothetical protein